MRHLLLAIPLLFSTIASAYVDVSVGVSLPGVSIGINEPSFPDLVPVPGYPVYYNPNGNSNYFFYDGEYWAYQNDNWYASTWYNGPWGVVGPEAVPLYVLRVPVRYYARPPIYFRGWAADAPPRWGDHWGGSWQAQHVGWDHFDARNAPRPAPLPTYQRQYSGARYPQAMAQQQSLRSQNYHYQPHENVVQQHFQARQAAPMNQPGPAMNEQHIQAQQQHIQAQQQHVQAQQQHIQAQQDRMQQEHPVEQRQAMPPRPQGHEEPHGAPPQAHEEGRHEGGEREGGHEGGHEEDRHDR